MVYFLLFSCKPPTVEEFKAKYDWEEREAVYYDFSKQQSGGVDRFRFEYENKTYRIIVNSGGADRYFGYKYPILFDKQNPDKNYKLLESYPIIESPVVFWATGKIRQVISYSDAILVRYAYYIKYSNNEIEKYKSSEYLPIEYLELCKKLKDSQDDIAINMHLFDDMYIPFINREILIDTYSEK